MPRYIVTVRRTAHGFRDFMITANDDVQARAAAENWAPNFGFSEKTSEYESIGAIELEPNQTTNLPELNA